jgi:hypothetical protein
MKDWITIVVAILALIQPWLIYLYKKIFYKPILKCFSDKSATLAFDEYGVSLSFVLTMISNKCDNVITNVEMNIYKGNSMDSKIYQMNWKTLFSIYKTNFRSEWGTSQDYTSFAPCPMYLTKGNPISYRILFRDEKLDKDFYNIIESDKGSDYIRDTLLTNFNFHVGNHLLELIFTDIKGKKKTFAYKFELSESDIDNLKFNATIISDGEKHADEEIKRAYIELETEE